MAPETLSLASPTSLESTTTPRSVARFSIFPPEIRILVWKFSLEPRIMKWSRVKDQNVFRVTSNQLPLLSVNHEAREIAFLYGEYKNVSTDTNPIYFSPVLDYMLFDPGWTSLLTGLQMGTSIGGMTARPDPLDSILPGLSTMRNIMVHPNYTDERKMPTTLFEKLSHLQSILVAADEKMMGTQSKFMLGSVYDIRKYYIHMARERNPDLRVPRIAVGCLGWTGPERWKIFHGEEDRRKLVAVFETHGEMKAHLAALREDQQKFLQERRANPQLAMHFQRIQIEAKTEQAMSGSPAATVDSMAVDEDVPTGPPPYDEIAGPPPPPEVYSTVVDE